MSINVLVRTALPGKPPKFTWGQLGKELHDIANTIVSSLMLANHMLALNLYQPLTTQIHEANKEDLLLPGGSNVKIDSSTPPSMAQDIDSKLHKHSDAGATRPKPEDLYIPGYTAYDGDPVLFMFKDSNSRGYAPDPYKRYHLPPDTIPFQSWKIVKPKEGRKRWALEDGRILEWDRQHGEFEMYDKRGKHIGVYDNTGMQIKPAVSGRKIEI